MSGSTQCPHTDVDVNFNIAAFGNTNIRYMEITGRCKICEAAMQFRGVPVGIGPNHPATDVEGQEIRLPFMFGEEKYDGNASGYSVTAVVTP